MINGKPHAFLNALEHTDLAVSLVVESSVWEASWTYIGQYN